MAVVTFRREVTLVPLIVVLVGAAVKALADVDVLRRWTEAVEATVHKNCFIIAAFLVISL